MSPLKKADLCGSPTGGYERSDWPELGVRVARALRIIVSIDETHRITATYIKDKRRVNILSVTQNCPTSIWLCALIFSGLLLTQIGCSSPDKDDSCSGASCDIEDNSDSQSEEDTNENTNQDSDFEDTHLSEPEPLCEEGSSECVDERTYQSCIAGVFVQNECEQGTFCEEGICSEPVCEPDEIRACVDASSFEVCKPTGLGFIVISCPSQTVCIERECIPYQCEPGLRRCADLETIEECDPQGQEFQEAEHCILGTECDEGACADLCTINNKERTYLGCEYWSLDLDNYDTASGELHAVVVSNPNEDLEAVITVEQTDVGELSFDQVTVPPLGLEIFPLPHSSISGSIINSESYKVISTVPVTMHQFNPLNKPHVYSNDGTLLLPAHVMGEEYLAMSWVHREDRSTIRGFITILNTSEQPTELTVIPSANTVQGPNVPSLSAWEEVDFTLQPGELLNLETLGEGDDLTGTEINSTLPVAVFGGHECANVLLGVDRCDHIEMQIFPIHSWGQNYIGTKFFPRGPEPDVYRVMASEDGTTVRTDPIIPDLNDAVLNRGEWIQFQTWFPLVIEASHPIMVGQYMVGANWLGIHSDCEDEYGISTGIGDPAFSLLVPIEQFRADYIVLTPQDYLDDYLDVVVPEGATVIMDGEVLEFDEPFPVGDGDYFVATVRVDDGPHFLSSEHPFGLVAYGYECHVSYAYPGGLNLDMIRAE